MIQFTPNLKNTTPLIGTRLIKIASTCMASQRQNPFGLQYPPAPGVNNAAREVLEPLNLSMYTVLTIQTSKKIKKIKISKSKSVSPRMSARSGLIGKIILAPCGAISG